MGGGVRGETINSLAAKGVYEDWIIEALRSGNIAGLNAIPSGLRSDKNFMLPILYAVKNEYKTFEVFAICGPSVRNDKAIVMEIIQQQPSLIEKSSLANDPDFIADCVRSGVTEVVNYVGEDIKSNPEVLEAMKETNEEPKFGDESIDMAPVEPEETPEPEKAQLNEPTVEQPTPEYRNSEEYLDSLNVEDRESLQETLSEITNNAEEFTVEVINEAQAKSKKLTIEDCISYIDEMAEKSDDERYGRVKNRIEEKGLDDPRVARWVAAMVAQSDEVSPEMLEKVLNYSVLSMEKSKQNIESNPDAPVDLEAYKEMVSPAVIRRLQEKAGRQNVELDENIQAKIDAYATFYGEYTEKVTEAKKELCKENEVENEAIIEEKTGNSDELSDTGKPGNPEVARDDVQEVAGKASMGEITRATQEISKGLGNKNPNEGLNSQEPKKTDIAEVEV